MALGVCQAEPTKPEPPAKKPTEAAGKPDGSSFEKAIAVKSIDDEYKWLRKNYSGYKLELQALTMHKGKAYDMLRIVTSKGEKKSIYFDISSFFGK
jgi:hypothetical protein